MKNGPIVLAGLALVAVLAAGEAPWRSLTPCLIGKWSGITATDPDGNLLGPADPSDWGCADHTPQSPSATRSDGVPVPPPTSVCFGPAAPNPTSGATRLSFALPAAAQVTVVVYGRKGNGPHGAFAVRTLANREMMAGRYEIIWDGNDDAGARLAPGIYRAALTAGDVSLCGDIEVR